MLRANPTAANPYAINIYNPIYGGARPVPTANTDTFERQRNTAFYLQDAIKLSPQWRVVAGLRMDRSEEHTSELQSHSDLVCRLLLEKKKNKPRKSLGATLKRYVCYRSLRRMRVSLK